MWGRPVLVNGSLVTSICPPFLVENGRRVVFPETVVLRHSLPTTVFRWGASPLSSECQNPQGFVRPQEDLPVSDGR